MVKRIALFISVAALAVGACSSGTTSTTAPSNAASSGPSAAPSSAAPSAATSAAPSTAPSAAASESAAASAPGSAAPSGAPGSPAPSSGTSGAPSGTLRFDWLGDLTPIWHPAGYETFSQAVIFSLVFDTLVKVDKDEQTIIPDLADSWEVSPDAKEYTFHLHPGITWQDGTPFTSKDVLFTINQSFKYKFRFTNAEWESIAGADAVKSGSAQTVSGATAPDDNTVKITLAQPNSQFLRQIVDPQDVIVPEHLLKDVDPATIEKAEFSTTKPVGTGPYNFVNYVTDQQAEFTANTNYFRGAPHINQLFMLRTPANAAVAQAASGGLDLVLRIAPADFDAASQIAGMKVQAIPGVGETSMEFNVKNVPSKEMRQAISYAIDRKGIVDSIFNGRADPLLTSIPPGFKKYDDLTQYETNVDKAKELLGTSGWDMSKPFRIIYDQTYPSVANYMPVIQQNLQDIGLNVELDPLDSTAFIARLHDQQTTYDASMQNGGDEGISPARTGPYFNCEDPNFRMGYQNCQVDDLFAKALQTSDATQQDDTYHQIAKILNDEQPSASLWSPSAVHIVSEKLGGGFAIYPNPRETFFQVNTWTFGQ